MKKSIENLNVPKSQMLDSTHLSKLKGGGVILNPAVVDTDNN